MAGSDGVDGARGRGRPASGPFAVGPVDLIAFLAELAALILLGCLGWRLGWSLPSRVSLALLLVVGAGLVWGAFASPRAPYATLSRSVATKVVVLGGSVVAAAVLLPPWFMVPYAVIVAVDTALLYVGPFARPHPVPVDRQRTATG